MWVDAAKIALQVSLIVMVLSYGLTADFSDVLFVLKRPALLARSLLAVLVITPLIAVLLMRLLDLRNEVAIALVALAISPLPPLLPRRGEKAGGHVQYGLGLVITLAVLAVPSIATAEAVLEIVFGQDYVVASWPVARLMAVSVLTPLILGMVIGNWWPAMAGRIIRPVERAQRWLLPTAFAAFLIASAPAAWNAIGDRTLVAMVVFVGVTFAAGHLLGGPDRPSAAVLAFAASCRHPATALTVAGANFPGVDLSGAIALYGLVTAVGGLFYTRWLRRTRA